MNCILKGFYTTQSNIVLIMSNNNDGGQEEEFDMAAIQAFMLGGKKKAGGGGGDNNNTKNDQKDDVPSSKKKKKKKKGKGAAGGSKTPTKTPPRPPASNSRNISSQKKKSNTKAKTPQTTPQQRREEQRIRNTQRQYWRLYKNFFSIVETEWLDLDDQLMAVVGSIDNIRSRLPMESRILRNIRDEDEWEAKKPWDGYAQGYSSRREHNFALRVEDVRLAQGYDLVQHEKMLAGLRRLLSALSEVQDALGRKLDELLSHHWECSDDAGIESAMDPQGLSTVSLQTLVDEASLVYNQLAMELYRKQGMVQELLDSVDDDMIAGEEKAAHSFGPEGDDILGGGRSSQKTASYCTKAWPRDSAQSCVESSLLQRCLKRCESNS